MSDQGPEICIIGDTRIASFKTPSPKEAEEGIIFMRNLFRHQFPCGGGKEKEVTPPSKASHPRIKPCRAGNNAPVSIHSHPSSPLRLCLLSPPTIPDRSAPSPFHTRLFFYSSHFEHGSAPLSSIVQKTVPSPLCTSSISVIAVAGTLVFKLTAGMSHGQASLLAIS